MSLNNASSNSIRPTRPLLSSLTTDKQDKPPIFLHRSSNSNKQRNEDCRDNGMDDNRYKRKRSGNNEYEMKNNYETDSRTRKTHHYHSPKHHHSHYNSPNSHQSSHSSKSHKSHSRSRSKNYRDRYHSSSTHSHHSSSQIIDKEQQQYKPKIKDSYTNFHKKHNSHSHSHSHISISSSSSSSSTATTSSHSPSPSPKRSKELQQPPKFNNNVEHNPNTPRDSKLTNILSSALPLPSPPYSPIIIPTFETANKNDKPSIIPSIHEIVENMRSNKSVDKALSNCGIENGDIVKSQNHYKNNIPIDDNPYFGFSKMNNLQYYIDNKDKSYNKDLENDDYFNNPYSLDNMIRFYGVYPNKSLINTDTFEERFYFDHMRESQNQKWAKERTMLGKQKTQEGKYKEAIDLLTQAIQICDDYIDAYFVRAVALTNQNSLQKAIKDFQTVLNADSNYPQAKEYFQQVKNFYEKTGGYSSKPLNLTC